MSAAATFILLSLFLLTFSVNLALPCDFERFLLLQFSSWQHGFHLHLLQLHCQNLLKDIVQALLDTLIRQRTRFHIMHIIGVCQLHGLIRLDLSLTSALLVT